MYRTESKAEKYNWGVGGTRDLNNIKCQQFCQGDAECQCWTRANKNCYLYKNKPLWGMPSESGSWSGARECKGVSILNIM